MRDRGFKICILCLLLFVINCESLKRVNPQYDLVRCVEENNRECAEKALSKWYAIPKPNINYPLQIAARRNFKEIADFLISKGANPNHQNPNGITAMHVAAMYGRASMLKFLVEKAGDPSIREKSGANALDMAVSVMATLHHTPNEANKLRDGQSETADVNSAKEIAQGYLECIYFLAGKNLLLANETVTAVEKFKNEPEIKPNAYTPYFETMYKYLQDKALLKPGAKG